MTTAKPVKPASYAAGSSLGQSAGAGFGSGNGGGGGAELLHAISRDAYRATVHGYSPAQSMHGVDEWQCFELSWLNPQGKPQVAAGCFSVPLIAPNIVESKSLKLYLNSFNQRCFASAQAFARCVSDDLSALLGSPVSLQLFAVDAGNVIDADGWRADPAATDAIPNASFEANTAAIQLDELEVTCIHYQRAPDLLAFGEQIVENECVVSKLLRSNCPVTDQPDWATLGICYSGQQLDHARLLQYIVSYRQHSGFHEQTVEQIFCDLAQRPELRELSVQARYTRRGGIAINPARSTRAVWE